LPIGPRNGPVALLDGNEFPRLDNGFINAVVDDGAGGWYEWLRDGDPIADADTGSYRLASVDADSAISCRVTGSSDSGQASADAPAVLAPAAPVAGAAVPTAAPTATSTSGPWAAGRGSRPGRGTG
jgi:hypothetical protein